MLFLSLESKSADMKYFFQILVLSILMGCGATKLKQIDADSIPKTSEVSNESVAVPPTDTKSTSATESPRRTNSKSTTTEIQFSDDTRVKGILNFLASDELEGRDSGSEGIEKAAQFIEGIFTQNKIAPYFDSFRDTLSNFSKPSYNIVGWVEGNDTALKNEFILIGAHYDHIGRIEPEGGDSIANGANDNASGTTTVLELARYFGNARTNKRSIMFVLFSAEEKGLLGSKHLAEKLKAQNLNLYLVLNYEMVGVPLLDKEYLTYASGYEKSNLAQICNTYAGQELVGFLPTAKKFNLFQRSDNYPFFEAFNVPAHTFCTFDFTNFDYYHKVGDEADLMDFEHMAYLVNQFIPVVEGMANTPVKEIKYN